MDSDEDESFQPRDYQNILASQAEASNKILFLPTGSGKTFISIMVLRSLLPRLRAPFGEGGERAVFLVNTVALVEQQAKVLKRHTEVEEVGQFSGDMNIDNWGKEIWLEQFREYKVMVMTAEIMHQLLLKSFISFKQLALMILDECHHAVEDHPMRQIMRLMEGCPADDQPRILGLTATLLNATPKSVDKIAEEVKKLEVTLHSTIATVNSWELVKKFSTKPRETVIPFQSHFSLNNDINVLVDNMVTLCKTFDFDLAKSPICNELKPGYVPLPRGKKNYIKNLVCQVSKQYTSLGPYGSLKTALAVAVTLHTIMLKTEEKCSKLALSCLLTKLSELRRILDLKMFACPRESERAVMCTSNKVLRLLLILKEHNYNCENKLQGQLDPMRVLVFVQERMTAKILSSVLRNAARLPQYSFIKTSFIVGHTFDPLNETWEAVFVKKNNMHTVKKFRNGELNVLVCSDVLEEGIDIPLCNMVVKFDEVLSFRSYIQSKGRARNKSSLFCLMVEENCEIELRKKLCFYNCIEEKLIELLVGKTDDRESPTEEELRGLYECEVSPYVTPSGAKVTMTSAISLINGFAMMLSRDRFSQHMPTWGAKVSNQEGNVVCVQLPKTSSFQELVEGPVMPNLKLAKRAAALAMCKKLHQAGEINDDLLPSEVTLTPEDTKDLFPLWENETSSSKPGTKSVTREYKQYKPKCLRLSGIEGLFYIHAIEMTPESGSQIDNAARFVHRLFMGRKQYCILSSMELQEVGSFPVFFKFGKIQVTVRPRGSCILTAQQLKNIQNYHFELFTSIIPIAKHNLYFKKSENQQHFLIVPIIQDGTKISIDWTAVHSSMTDKSVETPEEVLGRVIKPQHRAFSAMEVFIVCGVSQDITALTRFPNPEFKNYLDYFKIKYNVNISKPSLPLLEVVSIMLQTDAMLPRTGKKPSGPLGQHYTQHFPPEICVKTSLDASLCVQATLLPTILHRFERLLIANDLRVIIAEESGIGVANISRGQSWKMLESADSTPDCRQELTSVPSIPTVSWKEPLSIAASKKQMMPTEFDENTIDPVDIEREFESISYRDIEDYIKLTSKRMSVSSSPYRAKNKQVPHSMKSISTSDIKCLKIEGGLGPHPCHLYEAITASSSNDIVDYERFETLGDAFLKFSVSLFLFLRFPTMSEGHCTQVKGKLLGNRNLFYCAKGKGLGAFLKVKKMVPWNSYVPPHFCIPSEILESIQLSPGRGHFLQKLQLSMEERKNGFLFPQTILDFNKLEGNDILAFPITHLGMQEINDKCVADSVESLIGCILQTCGLTAAFTLLEWFRILPKFVYDDKLTRDILKIPVQNVKSCYVEGQKFLEARLGYNFKNSGLLLEALTHSSFPGQQRSYERLEFIGDAILDFLITSYIFENCGRLTPGELTDLRSALVNNITFACLTVRNGFQKFLLSASAALFNCIDHFVDFQENRGHRIDDEVLILLEEDECKLAETVDVPKALGDIFEALAGAVFLDSGNNLEIVWNVFYNLMKKEICLFSQNVPKQVVRRLYEVLPNGVNFRVSTNRSLITQTMVELSVTLQGEQRLYHGFGENKAQAKKSAAKLALRDLLFCKA